MNQYQELYKKKRMSAEQALELIQDGDSMFSAQAAAEPQAIHPVQATAFEGDGGKRHYFELLPSHSVL